MQPDSKCVTSLSWHLYVSVAFSLCSARVQLVFFSSIINRFHNSQLNYFILLNSFINSCSLYRFVINGLYITEV